MNIMKIQSKIQQDYNRVLKALERSPRDEKALRLLISLEANMKEYLFTTLQSQHGDQREQSDLYGAFLEGNTSRDTVEENIMSTIVGQ